MGNEYTNEDPIYLNLIVEEKYGCVEEDDDDGSASVSCGTDCYLAFVDSVYGEINFCTLAKEKFNTFDCGEVGSYI